MRYVNLDIEAFDYRNADGAETFRVRVANSPAGEQKLADAETVRMSPELGARLRRLERRALNLQEMIRLGEELAGLLFPPRVRTFFQRSRDMLDDDQGLRVRLRFDTYALADLPWEYVYLPRMDTPPDQKGPEGFLSLDRRISLVRYEVMEQQGSLGPVDSGALRLVALLANPHDPDYGELQLDVEQKNIGQALSQVPNIEVDFYPDATVDTFEDALARETHIFHFAGHGSFVGDLGRTVGTREGSGFIVLLDDNDRAMLFPANRLALTLIGRGVRLAVLGACEAARRDSVNAWTGVAPALTRAGIPAVLGMQYTIRDANALIFIRRFYQALASGQPIEAAIADGRLAIFNRTPDDERDWGVPVLYLRSADGLLFPQPQVVEEGKGWSELIERAQVQYQRMLLRAIGTTAHIGPFVPDLYVSREAAEQELTAFLSSDAAALILVGDSGVGKTNVLYQWTHNLLEAGHSALLYNCGELVNLDIEREIAKSLSLDAPDKLGATLDRISVMATEGGHRFVLVFDNVNEFHGAEAHGPDDLVRCIDSLVSSVPRNIQIVFSCNTATWKRFERARGDNLSWPRYFQPSAGERVLQLGLFTSGEMQQAYDRYQAFFHLRTPFAALPPALLERLQNPLLLRMLAEAYKDSEVRVAPSGLALSIFGRYFEERVRQRAELIFVDNLAAEMLRRRQSALPVDELARQEPFKHVFLSDEPDPIYARLLDNGILTESSGDLFQADVFKFTYTQIAAYALARHVLRQSGSAQQLPAMLAQLIRDAPTFSLAWDTARMVLLIYKQPAIFAELARSTDVELRELVVETLVELHTDQSATALEIIQQLIQSDSEEARRTGLKAAYRIGPAARSIFVWAAVKGSPAVRQATKLTLYLIWQTDPKFPYQLLNELVGQIGLSTLLDLNNIIEFVIDLSVTIYVNHLERDDVIQETTGLHYEMCKNRLHLDVLSNPMLRPFVETLIRAIANAFTKPMLDSMLLNELSPADRFFSLPVEQRASLQRIAPFLDPRTDLTQERADLVMMLQSDIIFFNIVVAMVLVVHAYNDFKATEPLLRGLFDELNGYARMWILLSFSVISPRTPPEWTEVVEDFTRRIVTEHPRIFFNEDVHFLNQFDILLLPLGLAYGKRGTAMPYIETLLRDGWARGDLRLVRRCIAGLGVVGFYFPQAVFQTLRAAIPDLTHADLRAVLVRSLAIIRTRHFDTVDIFLRQIGADDAFQHQVSVDMDVDLVRRYVYWLGLYNNTSHFSLHYPIMRRGFGMRGILLMSEVGSPQEFVSKYTISTFYMGRDAEYRFTNWTRPD